nr:hypothetical protein BaRGS_022684 [Batillaria attramentaria]
MDQNNLYELTWFNLVFFSLLPTTIILVGDLFLVKAVSKNAAQVGLSSVSTSFSVPPPLEETRSQHSSVSTGFSSSATDFDVKVYEVTSAEKQAYDSYERYGCRCCYLFADSMKRVLTVDPLSGDWFAAIRGTGKTVSPAKSTGTSTRRTTQTYGQFECMRRRACPQTTVSLMALTLMFLVLTPPLTVQTLRVERNPELGRQEEFRFYITLALLAWYANHAVKFYLMFLTGSVFKEQLKKILRVKEKKSSATYTKDSGRPQPSEFSAGVDKKLEVLGLEPCTCTDRFSVRLAKIKV